MKIIKIFSLLVFILAIYGCSHETSKLINKGDLIVPKRIGQTGRYRPDYQAMRKEAGQAYAAGLKKIMQESALSVGEVWVLSEILKYEPNIALREFQARSVDKLTGDPFLRLITPHCSAQRSASGPRNWDRSILLLYTRSLWNTGGAGNFVSK